MPTRFDFHTHSCMHLRYPNHKEWNPKQMNKAKRTETMWKMPNYTGNNHEIFRKEERTSRNKRVRSEVQRTYALTLHEAIWSEWVERLDETECEVSVDRFLPRNAAPRDSKRSRRATSAAAVRSIAALLFAFSLRLSLVSLSASFGLSLPRYRMSCFRTQQYRTT